MAKTTRPKGLAKRGAALWKAIADEYDLRADELRVLEDACREVDLVERLEAELATQTLTVNGSMGQPVPNGHLAELRQHRAAVARLLGSLKLPDESPTVGSSSGSAVKAAAARWSRSA